MSETTKPIVGVLPVFQTPYHEDESVDYETLATEIDWLYAAGADGVVMAMVSEVLRLSAEERDEMARRLCEISNRRGCVVISVGAESSHTAARFAANAQSAGAAAVMAIPPVSVAVGPAELENYYRRIFEAIDLPVIVQDASGYVGQPMSIEFQAGLLDEYGPERALFKPEAAPIGQRLSALRDATGGRAKVFEGTGGIALVDSHQRGIVGTIPGADLIHAIIPLWRALERGDLELASRIHGPLSSLITLQNTLDSFLAVEKHLLVRQGIFKNQIIRGPRGFRLDDETRTEVDRLFDLVLAAATSDQP
jgi:4-hydroxy-tetrahydrodipicolinate synthase